MDQDLLNILIIVAIVAASLASIFSLLLILYVFRILNDVRKIIETFRSGAEIVKDDFEKISHYIAEDKGLWRSITSAVLWGVAERVKHLIDKHIEKGPKKKKSSRPRKSK